MRKDATWPADRVERWPLAKLVPNARNARTHSDDQVTQLAASIEEWGWTIPVLVDEAGGIIAGHGRVMAAHRLGLEDVPIMVAAGWSESKKRAYMLADNKLTLNAEWDLDRLALEIAELRASDFDISLIGFSESEIDDLLKADGGGLTDPEEAPDPPADPISALGDVWQLGRHRLVCGDCTDAEVVANLCSGVVPDLANCDPPYGVSIVKGSAVGGAKPFGSVGRTDTHAIAFGKIGGGKPHPYAGAKQSRVLHGPTRKEIIRPGVYAPVIGDDSTDTAIKGYSVVAALGVPAIVLWGGNYFANHLPPSRCWLVWDKENTGTFADAELAWTNQDKITKLFRHQWSGLMKASERGERRVHPTQKPAALAEWVIKTIAPQCGSVLDLFLGSGSTLIACERLKKQCFAMELSPDYVDVSVLRWQNFTGQQATLEATGEMFAEVATGRLAPSAGSVTSATKTARASKQKAGALLPI